jgi:hypothetical protein
VEARQRDGVRALRIGLVVAVPEVDQEEAVPEVDQEAPEDVKSQIVFDNNPLSAKAFGILVPARTKLDHLDLSKIVGEAPILVLEMIELGDQNPVLTGMDVLDPLIIEKERTILSSNLTDFFRVARVPRKRKASNDSIPNQDLPPRSEKDTLHMLLFEIL